VQRLREARTRKMEPEELAKINAEALATIQLSTAERGTWDIKVARTLSGRRKANREMEKKMKEASRLLATVLHPSLFAANTTVAETDSLRAECVTISRFDPVTRTKVMVANEIRAHISRPIRTLIHEACHAVETMSDVYESMVAFRAKRTAGESLQQLRKLYPMMNYGPGEVAWEDEWVKRGGSHYSGKKYPDSWRATEIFTKGMERLILETAEFAADDPEYFEAILKAAQKL